MGSYYDPRQILWDEQRQRYLEYEKAGLTERIVRFSSWTMDPATGERDCLGVPG
jgi:hypothetical protein